MRKMPYNLLSPGSAISISNQVGIGGALARFSRRSYAIDYIALATLVAAWVLVLIFVKPFYRMFYLDDRALQHPFAVVERVDVLTSILYAGVVPFLVIVVWTTVGRSGSHKTQVTILGLLVALMLSTFIVDIVKNAVGRPRPDLLSRCRPVSGLPSNELVRHTVCTQTNQHILEEGWRSFPSGHSSFSFAGLGYLSLFFSGQMLVFRPRTDLARFLLVLAPLLGATMIATSRLQDYRHDFYDVACGSVLGLLVAYLSYRRYYPSLWSGRCDTPYNKDDVAASGKTVADEEQGPLNVSVSEEGRDLVHLSYEE